MKLRINSRILKLIIVLIVILSAASVFAWTNAECFAESEEETAEETSDEASEAKYRLPSDIMTVSGLKVTNQKKSITLQWDVNEDASCYFIYRRTGVKGDGGSWDLKPIKLIKNKSYVMYSDTKVKKVKATSTGLLQRRAAFRGSLGSRKLGLRICLGLPGKTAMRMG